MVPSTAMVYSREVFSNELSSFKVRDSHVLGGM